MEYIKVAVDAMGGDNAPVEMVKGAIEGIKENTGVKVFLVGPKSVIEKELANYQYDKELIEIVEASEVITCDESPVEAIRGKKDSSLVKGLSLIKSGDCDAFISAGSTGAILVGGQLLAGRLKGVERAPLAPVIPTAAGSSLLIDCGANVDARASHLLQFAKMGSIYMEHIVGIKNPTVAILNIGTEEEKGNALVKETYPLLKECKDINFIGSIEARDVPLGGADVVVCEAFAGNVLLKTYEGVGKTLFSEIKKSLMSSIVSKLGALLIKKSLKATLKKFTADEYGGAPLLGLKGLVIKVHGNATYKEIKNSIKQCVTFKEQAISEKISEKINGSI